MKMMKTKKLASELTIKETEEFLQQAKEKITKCQELIQKSTSNFEKMLLRNYIDKVTYMIQNLERSLV